MPMAGCSWTGLRTSRNIIISIIYNISITLFNNVLDLSGLHVTIIIVLKRSPYKILRRRWVNLINILRSLSRPLFKFPQEKSVTQDAELRSPSFGKLDARACSSVPVSLIVALRSTSPSQRDMTSRSLRPIATAMDRKSSSDHGDDRKRASQLGRRRRSEARREATHPTTLLSCRDNAGRSSIAMRIASEYIDRDESRERAGSVATMFATNHTSSNATRVAMNSFMFDCEEGRNKRTTSLNAKTRTKCNQRSKETCTFGLLGLIGFARAHQSLAEEVKKESTIN